MLILDKVKVGLSTSVVVVLPTELSEKIGRLGVPKIEVDLDNVMLTYKSVDRGYQWSSYKEGTRRVSIGRKYLEVPEGLENFGMSEVYEAHLEDGRLVLILRRAELTNLQIREPRKPGPNAGVPRTPTPGKGPIFRHPAKVVEEGQSPQNPQVTNEQLKLAIGIVNQCRKERGVAIEVYCDEEGWLRARVITTMDL